MECHNTCISFACFDRHLEKRLRKDIGDKSNCEIEWKCTECKKIVNTRERNPKEHECGEWFCNCCKQYVENDHLCYIRALEPKEPVNKFIFFDFECTQEDDVMMCQDGYYFKRNPDCQACKDEEMMCNNCEQS